MASGASTRRWDLATAFLLVCVVGLCAAGVASARGHQGSKPKGKDHHPLPANNTSPGHKNTTADPSPSPHASPSPKPKHPSTGKGGKRGLLAKAGDSTPGVSPSPKAHHAGASPKPKHHHKTPGSSPKPKGGKRGLLSTGGRKKRGVPGASPSPKPHHRHNGTRTGGKKTRGQ